MLSVLLIMAILATQVVLKAKSNSLSPFLTLLIFYVIPVVYFPSQYFPREFAEPQMLAFNHETKYVNGKVIFFSGAISPSTSFHMLWLRWHMKYYLIPGWLTL
jgi:hypothetical protein